MLNRSTQPKSTPCAGCGGPGVAGEIWGNNVVCHACFGAWMRDDQFSEEVVNKHLGLSSDPLDYTKANFEAYCAEVTKRTNAWLAARRKTARAA